MAVVKHPVYPPLYVELEGEVMAHTEEQIFQFGKTMQVKASVQKAKAHEFADADLPEGEYTHQSIVGIEQIEYNANVGHGEPKWRELEKNLDVAALIDRVSKLERELKGQKMYVGRLKRQLQSAGVVAQEMEKDDA